MKSLEENTRETLQDCLVDDFLAKIKQYCKKKQNQIKVIVKLRSTCTPKKP